MAYPTFDETMVDLTWIELEKKAKENLPVILPVGIIEEHGPHMDLAPDVYLIHRLAKEVKSQLKKKQVDSLIAPPMYWGVSKCTESFPGTFSVRPETMIAIMFDLVSSLHKWGFNKIFIINGHGDYIHINTIINSIKNIKEKIDLNIYFLFEEDMVTTYGLDENKEHLLLYKFDAEHRFSDFADIHAGGGETSAMLNSFPNSVSKEKLSKLEDSKIKYEQLYNWHGDEARKLTPLGYCGNPSNYNIEAIKKIEKNGDYNMTKSILSKLAKL